MLTPYTDPSARVLFTGFYYMNSYSSDTFEWEYDEQDIDAKVNCLRFFEDSTYVAAAYLKRDIITRPNAIYQDLAMQHDTQENIHDCVLPTPGVRYSGKAGTQDLSAFHHIVDEDYYGVEIAYYVSAFDCHMDEEYYHFLDLQPKNEPTNYNTFSVVEEIEKAKKLLDLGVISLEEFNTIKANLISKM